MKLRVIDRLIDALVGIVLIGLSALLLVGCIFTKNLPELMSRMTQGMSGGALAAVIIAMVLFFLLGALCIHQAMRREGKKTILVDHNDVGELTISMRAVENLVNKCVEKHEELHVSRTSLENTRDGLVVTLKAAVPSGVNIPMAANMLQRQIKQYVTACSGVDVYEVKVQVESTSAKGASATYAVPDLLDVPAALPREEEKKLEAAPEAKEEKLLHQRLFSTEEQPAIVPAPPAAAGEEEAPEAEAPVLEIAQEEAADEVIEEAAEEIVQTVETNDVLEAWNDDVPADEIIEAWENSVEELAAEAASEEPEEEIVEEVTEETVEEGEYTEDADDVAELAELDGACEEELLSEEEEEVPTTDDLPEGGDEEPAAEEEQD